MSNDCPHDDGEPSLWIQRFAGQIPRGGVVLDLAAGRGRHTRYLLKLGHSVVATDIDTSGLRSFEKNANVEILEVDLEGETWPLANRSFDGIVVTNYLYRPRLLKLVDALSPGGVLIYETFAKGNEAYGRPANPDYLLNPAELLEVFSTSLTVIAYEHGIDEEPTRAVRQRLCAQRSGPSSK